MTAILHPHYGAQTPPCMYCGGDADKLVSDHVNRPIAYICNGCVPQLDRAVHGRIRFVD